MFINLYEPLYDPLFYSLYHVSLCIFLFTPQVLQPDFLLISSYRELIFVDVILYYSLQLSNTSILIIYNLNSFKMIPHQFSKKE